MSLRLNGQVDQDLLEDRFQNWVTSGSIRVCKLTDALGIGFPSPAPDIPGSLDLLPSPKSTSTCIPIATAQEVIGAPLVFSVFGPNSCLKRSSDVLRSGPRSILTTWDMLQSTNRHFWD